MKIQELTEKIYQDGIEKVKQEERAILDGARREADEILEAARKQAESITGAAQREADQTKTRLAAEIKLASSQALSLLRQQITDLLSEAAVAPAIKKAVDDAEFIGSFIRAIADKWTTAQSNLDLMVVLPEERKQELLGFFKSKASDLLSKGLEIRFQSRMQGGFQLGPADNSYKLSFSDRDFVQFFKSFLRQKTKEILFPGTET